MDSNTKCFCTAINCIDGRIQLPVIEYLKDKFKVNFVDMVTEAGPIKIISEKVESDKIERIKNLIKLSIDKHGSKSIAIIGHHDCSGNKVKKEIQLQQIEKSINILKEDYEDYNEVKFIGLWVDELLKVNEV